MGAPPQDPSWLSVVPLGAIAVVLFLLGLRALRRKRLIEDVPTSPVKGVFAGVNELKGSASTTTPLTSYLAGTMCVWYRYEVGEHWRRTVTERDADGKERTKTESGWTTVASGDVRQPFSLTDRTGTLTVRPEGAEIDGQVVFSESVGREAALYYDKGPPGAVADSTGERRFTEWAIPTRAAIYVMGPARMGDDATVEIAHDEGAGTYLISTRSEAQLTRGYEWQVMLCFLGAIVMAFLAPGGLGHRGPGGAAMPYMQASGALAAAAVAVAYLVLVYNGLVAVRARVERAFSLIDIQLKRRHDLIPRLVDCVKAYAAHEARLQEAVAMARSAAPGAPAGTPTIASVRAVAGVVDRQTAALSGIRAVAEAYPDVAAGEVYMTLQRELGDTEDRIGHARAFFNDSVTAYNDRIGQYPDALIASTFGFRRIEEFTIRDFDGPTGPRVARLPEPPSGAPPAGPRPGASVTPRRYEGRGRRAP